METKKKSQPGTSKLWPSSNDIRARRNWNWIECVYCRGQGYVVRPVWLLAWLHPDYPDIDRVARDLHSVLGETRLDTLPVRDSCTWCSGHGQRYDTEALES